MRGTEVRASGDQRPQSAGAEPPKQSLRPENLGRVLSKGDSGTICRAMARVKSTRTVNAGAFTKARKLPRKSLASTLIVVGAAA